MTPLAALEVTGKTLYGERWRAPLARSIKRPGSEEQGVSERLLHHWLEENPGRPVPDWVPAALVHLLQTEAERRKQSLGDLADTNKETIAS